MQHSVEKWRWNRQLFSVSVEKSLLLERVDVAIYQPADVVPVFDSFDFVLDHLSRRISPAAQLLSDSFSSSAFSTSSISGPLMPEVVLEKSRPIELRDL